METNKKKNQSAGARLASNMLLFTIGTFGSKILTFLLVRFYTDILTPLEMSRASIILQTCFLLLPLCTFSLEEAVLRFGLDTKKKYNLKKLYSTAFFVSFIWDIVFFLILIPIFLGIPDTKNYIWQILTCIFASGMRKINQQAIRSEGKVRLFAFDGILTTGFYIFFTVLFMKTLGWGVTGYITATTVSDLCSSFFLLVMGDNFKKLSPKYVSKRLLKEMLRYCLPLMPTAILWWIVSASDLFMVKYFVGEEENGLYSVAYKIPTLIAIMSQIFYSAWQMSATEQANSSKVGKFYSDVFGAFQSFLYCASAGVLLLLEPLTKLLTAEEFHSAYIYSPLLVISTLFGCFCQFFGGIYTAFKKSKSSFWTCLIAAGFNVILNLILIPKIGVQGAALATMVSYGVCSFIRLFDTKNTVHYKSGGMGMLLNLTALGTMCLVYFCDFEFKFMRLILLILGFIAVVLFSFSGVWQVFLKLIKKN